MTNKTLPLVGGLAQSDAGLSSASRPSRHTGTDAFAALLGAQQQTPAGAASVSSMPRARINAEALTAMSRMVHQDSLPSGGASGRSGMDKTLEATLSMPSTQARDAQTRDTQARDSREGMGTSGGADRQDRAEAKTNAPHGISFKDTPARTHESGTLLHRPKAGISLYGEGGIALADRGIAIDVRRMRGEGVHNIALNRNRPNLIDREAFADAQRLARLGRLVKRQQAMQGHGLGALAARYESGSEGIAAIGYDRVGGTSYGKYQIASRPGSMDAFLRFLDTDAPELANRLRASGQANTGSRSGGMPEEWKRIASEQPDRFGKLQEAFIRKSHYEPALKAVQAIGYDTKAFSPAMQEVLWSTAVQHGPAGAANIFSRVAEGLPLAKGRAQQRQEQAIIHEVYSVRAECFGSSSPQIQESARKRMISERALALGMAAKGSLA